MLRRLALAAVVMILSPSANAADAAAGTPAIRWEAHEIRSYDGRTLPAMLGRISVPEQRAVPGRMIELGFIRLPSTSPGTGNPIVFLMGGPGVPGSVMAPIPPYFTLFDSLRSVADVIIADQRGLGFSTPVLECAAEGALPADIFQDRENLVNAIGIRVAECARRWRDRGANPCAYSTVEGADDLEDLRRALGARQLDLLGFSYGTRLALATLARHPGTIGRVALAGVNSPLRPGKVRDAIDRKLRMLSQKLTSDSTRYARMDLLAAARTVKERLRSAPATVQATDRAGRRVNLSIGWEGFASLVALHLDDNRLPALLSATAAGDDTVLARIAEGYFNALEGAPTGLMARAVMCATGVSSGAGMLGSSPRDGAGTVFDEPVDNEFLSDHFCRSIGCPGMSPEFVGPVRSDIPALFITGELDCTTPAANAIQVRSGFSHGIAVEVENAGHETLPFSTVQRVVVAFFRGGIVRPERIAAPPPAFASIAEAKEVRAPRGR